MIAGQGPSPRRLRVVVTSTVLSLGHQVATAMGAAGAKTCVIGPGGLSTVRFSRHCGKYITARRSDLEEGPDSFLQMLEGTCRSFGCDVLIPADLPTLLMVVRRRASISARLFPVPESEAAIHRLHHKWQFSQLARDLDLPHPHTRLVRNVRDVASVDLPFPLVAKPVDQAGGLRVERLESRDALLRYVELSGSEESIVQTFIEGEDIDISFLADRGRLVAWTIQRRDAGHSRMIHFLNHDQVLDVTRHIVEAVRYHGVAHLDFRIDRATGRAYILECNPRFWGSLLYSVWAGVNFPALGADLAFGRTPSQPFQAPVGECLNSGLSPRSLLRSILKGRIVPPDLPPASRQSWIHNHTDPLPLVWGKMHSLSERRTR